MRTHLESTTWPPRTSRRALSYPTVSAQSYLPRTFQSCNAFPKCCVPASRMPTFPPLSPMFGFVDEENPPKCRSLNKDRDLQLIPSERFAAFVRAIRKKWRPWLQQLGGKMREAVRADGMPETIYQKNGGDFLMMIQRHRANMLTIAIWRDALAGVSLAQSNTSIGWPLTSRGSEGE